MPTEPSDLITGDAEVRAILADPAYLVPPAPPVPLTEHGTLAWLRAHVARFCDGQEHDRRRAITEQELARLDPVLLRSAAAELAGAELDRAELDRAALTAAGQEEPFDVMVVARRVPAAVLATALGVAAAARDDAVDAVLAAASGYPNPDLAGPGADAGVQFLAAVLGPADAELLATRIGLLEQACDATAALIGNALISAFTGEEYDQDGTEDAEQILAGTLASDPPVRRTRRLAPDGATVTLDLRTCTFGAGRRPCPGADQAMALAAGVLDAVLSRCELADQQLSYLPSPNLRMPARLLVDFTGGR
jgi:cytochrome P450